VSEKTCATCRYQLPPRIVNVRCQMGVSLNTTRPHMGFGCILHEPKPVTPVTEAEWEIFKAGQQYCQMRGTALINGTITAAKIRAASSEG